MSGYNYDDDFDDMGHESQETGGGLRRLYEEQLKENRELKQRLDRIEQSSTIDSLLKSKGIDPAVKDLIPEGGDAAAWLEKYQQLHGSHLDAGDPDPTPDQSQVDPDLEAERAAQAAMQPDAEAGGTSAPNDPFAQLSQAKTYEEMLELIHRAQGAQEKKGLFG